MAAEEWAWWTRKVWSFTVRAAPTNQPSTQPKSEDIAGAVDLPPLPRSPPWGRRAVLLMGGLSSPGLLKSLTTYASHGQKVILRASSFLQRILHFRQRSKPVCSRSVFRCKASFAARARGAFPRWALPVRAPASSRLSLMETGSPPSQFLIIVFHCYFSLLKTTPLVNILVCLLKHAYEGMSPMHTMHT